MRFKNTQLDFGRATHRMQLTTFVSYKTYRFVRIVLFLSVICSSHKNIHILRACVHCVESLSFVFITAECKWRMTNLVGRARESARIKSPCVRCVPSSLIKCPTDVHQLIWIVVFFFRFVCALLVASCMLRSIVLSFGRFELTRTSFDLFLTLFQLKKRRKSTIFLGKITNASQRLPSTVLFKRPWTRDGVVDRVRWMKWHGRGVADESRCPVQAFHLSLWFVLSVFQKIAIICIPKWFGGALLSSHAMLRDDSSFEMILNFICVWLSQKHCFLSEQCVLSSQTLLMSLHSIDVGNWIDVGHWVHYPSPISTHSRRIFHSSNDRIVKTPNKRINILNISITNDCNLQWNAFWIERKGIFSSRELNKCCFEFIQIALTLAQFNDLCGNVQF